MKSNLENFNVVTKRESLFGGVKQIFPIFLT